jgi:pimeloyl-ACP methyl ester carboxylesterase
VFGGLGFRAVAPDLRGYGDSTVYDTHDAYSQEKVVGDMIQLLDSLEADKAIFVGHDWGSPTVWALAAHHADRCHGIASLCVPYFTAKSAGPFDLIDRDIYPADTYPAGQWDYQLNYLEDFAGAQRVMEANVRNTLKALFRKGDPSGRGKPALTASIRRDGWFGGLDAAPDLPRDGDIVSEEHLDAYTEKLERNGFFGPNSYYMNHEANGEYASRAPNEGVLSLPVLFLAAEYDWICETVDSRLGEPMRENCRDLTEHVVRSGHWMAQEKPREVNAALAGWVARKLPHVWPEPRKL